MINSFLEHKVSHGGTQKPPGVRNIIGISSGKGGVGKTTITLQLAMYLYRMGVKVGIVDADIYGPNIMAFTPTEKSTTLEPHYIGGIPCASMSNIVPPDQALMWRGPMIGKAAMQLIMDTPWHDIDVLIVDCPPGTGDVHLTLLGQLAWVGYILVTTPHIMSQAESLRAQQLFAHHNIPKIATLVNLHHILCPACGHNMSWLGESSHDIPVAYHPEWVVGQKSDGEGDYMWAEQIMAAIHTTPQAETVRGKKLTIPIKETQ